VADEVFAVTGRNRLLDIALELERIALEDEYFISRKLYPNVDFYSGIIYQAMGLPEAMFPVMFAIPRTVRLAGTMAGDDQRPGAKNRPATPNLCWTAAPRLAEEEESTNSMTPAAITGFHSISHSSPIAVFQNSNRYLRRASNRVWPASAAMPEPSLGLRQERHFLLYQRTSHRKRR
jgi:hypothetical protein